MAEKKNVVAIEGRDEFMDLCVKVLPHLTAIQDALVESKASGKDEGASISVHADGYISFHLYGSKWEMNKYSSDAQAKIKYEHSEVVELTE